MKEEKKMIVGKTLKAKLTRGPSTFPVIKEANKKLDPSAENERSLIKKLSNVSKIHFPKAVFKMITANKNCKVIPQMTGRQLIFLRFSLMSHAHPTIKKMPNKLTKLFKMIRPFPKK